jgi:hypothetical protein
MDDYLITRIREARHQVSVEQTHDPRRIVAYYIDLQKEYGPRLLETPQTDEGAPTPNPDPVAQHL